MDARQPFQLSLKRWWRATRRIARSVASDNLSLTAAGVAFYALLAAFPAAAVAMALFGLVADESVALDAMRQLDDLLPEAATSIVTNQLVRIADGDNGLLSTGAITGLAFALWSANRGTKSLITGLNVAYAETESRNLLALNGLATALTGGLLTMAMAMALFASWSVGLTDRSGLSPAIVGALRWGVALVALHTALATLYRFGPNRRQPRWPWVGVGTVLASLGCLVTSAGFSLYVDRFASYNETFGALAGVAITMTWLWANAFVVLAGAEINAELEHETLADSTVGPDKPRGERGAWVADHIPDELANP
jgi:membrane protein